MTTPTPTNYCPDSATVTVPDPLRHPDGMHRCMREIPEGRSTHLGLHICVCGVTFVVTASKPARSRPPAPVDGVVYLLWSQMRGAWWRTDGLGYTDSIDEAGRFTEAEAVPRVVASAQSGIRDKVTFMVAAPDNWDDRVLKTPDEWQRLIPDVVIRDADGWRGTTGRPWDDPITRSEYIQRRDRCTLDTRAGLS